MTEIIISVFFIISVVVGVYIFFKNNKGLLSFKEESKIVEITLPKRVSKRKTIGSPRKKSR